jgi:hypothetical protein
MMTTENARVRLRDAVGILVDEKGRIKQRLMVAYVSQLSRIDPDHELPDHIVPIFDALRFTLTTDVVAGDCGTVSAELESISEEEASKIARQVFDMFLEVHELKESSHESGIDTR